ncbi:myogenesis-regulating glycosidase-like [Petromyzon marinus]|uniref:myogenesis-regulating glycosidase-like n=1 Tax=Petromyzon marinus TaxID=7757 RepID=UPI003F7112D6
MSQGGGGGGGGGSAALSSGGAMYHVVPGVAGPPTVSGLCRRRPPSRQPRVRVALALGAVALVAAAVATWATYAASVRAAGERAVGRLVLSTGGLTLRGAGAGDSKPALRVAFGKQQARVTLGTLGSGCVRGSNRRTPDDDADDDGGDKGDDGSYSYDNSWPVDDGECVHGESADAKVSVKKIDIGAAAAAASAAAAAPGNAGDASRPPAECYGVTWTASRPGVALEDCVVLGDALWYGGAQMRVQRWPLEFGSTGREPVAYVPEDIYSFRDRFGAVMERYWLSSRGAYIFVADDVPLYVSWSTVGAGAGEEKVLCLRAQYGPDGPYCAPSNASRAFLSYELCVAGDARAAHALASSRHLGAPSAPPDERMVRCPVWSTWALHKRRLSQAKVVALAEAVVQHGFNHSHLQVDDGYEAAGRYGDYAFDGRKFPDPAAMVRDLRSRLGFRLVLWVHPFVNYDAEAFRAGVAKGLFVRTAASNAGGGAGGGSTPALVRWWRGVATVLDVTNPAAVDAFVNRTLRGRLAVALGFDSFKFDGGEVSYLPRDCARTHAGLANPAWFSARYATLARHFGPLAEVRVAFRTHGLAAFVRMADRASVWGHELGLRSLIPTALAFGLLGYPYVLPDTIGGNAYGAAGAAPASRAGVRAAEPGGEADGDSDGIAIPERELYIRWLELSAFMPAMQFSVPPWLYDEEVVAIARKFTALREEVVAPIVMAVARAAAQAGGAATSSSNNSNDIGGRGTTSSSKSSPTSFSPPTPMIARPVWWAAPRDRTALRLDSEFLLGDAMLVAPVLEAGARARDVYLPAGTWCARMGGGGGAGGVASGGGRCHPGQKWLRNFEVALDEVAYFVRKS